MEIYDTTELSFVEVGDGIVYTNDEGAEDIIELTHVIDSGNAIMIKGYSHVTGDNVCYILDADTEVGLWTT